MRRGWKEGREGGSDRQQRGERQVRQGGREGERERERERDGGQRKQERRCTHTHPGRQGGKQEGVKVKTITRGAGSVRLCAAPWKCQALCSLTVSCTRRPESAGSLTKTDSSN